MQVTYSAELIKKVVQSDVFLDYRRIIESGESLPYKDLTFVSNEQFMMYCKAKQFKDEATAQAILKVNDHPLAQQFLQGKLTSQQIVQQSNHADAWNQLMQGIKKLGRQVANYDDAVWSDKRKTAVCVGAREKFTQNPDIDRKSVV